MNLALLAEWHKAQDTLAEAKERESRLRKLLLADFFTSLKPEGTTSLDLGEGWKLKATTSLDYKVHDAPRLLSVAEAIQSPHLVKTRYDLSLAAYRELKGDDKLLVDHCLIVKPASTQLKLEAPKA